MISIFKQHSKIIERIIDFVILSALFFLSCQIVPSSFNENIVITSIIYAVVVSISLQFCNILVQSALKSKNSVIKLMLSYAGALLMGTAVMLVIALITSSMQGLSVVAILASIMAFFVLGTVSPLKPFNKNITQ